MTDNVLNLFDRTTAEWFTSALGSPTPVQVEAWPRISEGFHTLVSAPTGTGKTLTAFLVFIDRLKALSRARALKNELHLIYISPLKSLAGDIRANLRSPLDGIYKQEEMLGVAPKNAPFDINIAIRTGDTPAADRKKMISTPPHILITTPESLYLLLTSASGQRMLSTAKAIVIDELHAMIDTKRGAHLMLSIARLDKLCPKPLQRIGLSATIEPLETAAMYLSPDPVAIVAPKMHKDIDLRVLSPRTESGFLEGAIWPALSRIVFEKCNEANSVIAFVDGRRYAEKLAFHLNEMGGDGFARTHHGSMSKEHRLQVEQALRDGELKLLCATSSMELGIDVGDVDLVLQIGCPMTIAGAKQRLGRSGHNPGRVSVMYMFPRTSSDGLYCGITGRILLDGGIEHTKPPKLCLDVLAQHLVSMALGDGYSVTEVMPILSRAYPFMFVTEEDVKSVLRMLAGDYEHDRDIPVRPRILYDRINERVAGDTYSRMLAVSSGGTIPDTGQFAVRLENGTKLGELDEEFVFETREGYKFLLGSFAWKIVSIRKDEVIVTQTNAAGALPPFWKAAKGGRPLETGLQFGRAMREIYDAMISDDLEQTLERYCLDETSVNLAKGFLESQIRATGLLPDDRTIVVEHFNDEGGDNQVMVHSMFGRKVNAPLALLASHTVKQLTQMDVNVYDAEEGFLLFPFGVSPIPQGILKAINPETARSILEALLPATQLFNMAFRYNSGRALMMGVRKAKRVPLWLQRLRAAEMLDNVVRIKDHPLMVETRRECIEDYWDLHGLEYVLNGIQTGAIQIREVFTESPSPMSLPFTYQAESDLLYTYFPTTSKIQASTQIGVEELEGRTDLLTPDPEQILKVSERLRSPQDPDALHTLLMIEGDLCGEPELSELEDERRTDGGSVIDWLTTLAGQNRALYVEPGLWIAAEQAEEYKTALESTPADQATCFETRKRIVRRVLRYRGAQTIETISARYIWPLEAAKAILDALCADKSSVFVPDAPGIYYHAELYERARRETVKSRRAMIKTQPPERYAALFAARSQVSAPAAEQLVVALTALCNQEYQADVWEDVILPARVSGYRPAMLDTLLTEGHVFWRLSGNDLSFCLYEDIDWDADVPYPWGDETGDTGSAEVSDEITSDEKAIYDALLKRGASFMHMLTALLQGDVLVCAFMSLAERGLVHADSFAPIRSREELSGKPSEAPLDTRSLSKQALKGRVGIRVKALTTGRWELTRPLKNLSAEERIERAFERSVILCKETILFIPWAEALQTLRVWEYTGRVRRGYFVEGLSGAQFIRDTDFNTVMQTLEHPVDDIIWLPAIDPNQPWGRKLAHIPGRDFICVAGTYVALKSGMPIAVFERKGQTLRVFETIADDDTSLTEALKLFATGYAQRRFYSAQKRLTVKQYPEHVKKALRDAGFESQMNDFVLYQGYK